MPIQYTLYQFYMKISYFIALCMLVVLYACKGKENTKVETAESKVHRFAGSTMGSSYSVAYVDTMEHLGLQRKIESLFEDFTKKLSTYDSTSLLSQFNQTTNTFAVAKSERYFLEVFYLSKRIYEESDGYFNPAIKPLVNYWGFGYDKKRPIEKVNAKEIDSLLKIIDFSSLEITETSDSVYIKKTIPTLQLEYNAIAPGYAGDLVAELLQSQGIENYLIEVGGELLAKGTLMNNKPWKVGINVPLEGAKISDFQAIVELKNSGLGTSGNYRSYYEKDGKKYVHTVNPKTGYTEQNTLLSISIFAPTCAESDAYATVCMVKGKEGTLAFLEKMPHIPAYLIFINDKNELEELWVNNAKQYFLE